MRKKSESLSAHRGISILALDDDPVMTITLQSYFQNVGFDVDVENDPEAAVERVRRGNYDILLLDFLMTPICGDQVVEQIRRFNKDLFIILLTGHKSMAPPIKTIRALDIQGYYEKSDRFDQLELLVESCVKSIEQMRIIKRQNEQLQQSTLEIIRVLRLAVDARDIYTRGHSDRVSFYAFKISRAMGRDEEYCQRVRLAGLFHDVGKLNIPDTILLKNGALTDEEYEVIKTHSAKGSDILKEVSAFSDIAPIVRSHHERWDGRGYPDGLAGEDIPEEARIITVADAFDAMCSSRVYRQSLGVEYAAAELKKCSGSHFDGMIAGTFIKLLEHYDELNAEFNAFADTEIKC